MLHKCLKFLVFFTIFSSFSSISFAFCKYEYDYQSGNSYTICDNGAGGTSLMVLIWIMVLLGHNNKTEMERIADGMDLVNFTLVIIILVFTIILGLVKCALGQGLLEHVIKIIIWYCRLCCRLNFIKNSSK